MSLCTRLFAGAGIVIVWTQWTQWNNCPQTCGNGIQRSTRSCSGGSCNAPTSRTRNCQGLKPCPGK